MDAVSADLPQADCSGRPHAEPVHTARRAAAWRGQGPETERGGASRSLSTVTPRASGLQPAVQRVRPLRLCSTGRTAALDARMAERKLSDSEEQLLVGPPQIVRVFQRASVGGVEFRTAAAE